MTHSIHRHFLFGNLNIPQILLVFCKLENNSKYSYDRKKEGTTTWGVLKSHFLNQYLQ